ncbi:hypothetical protein JFL43_05160 [Viridibacillus sp. YIM B01967]|uniref:2TM domain-containing protein n=1 Tax=Viridibacillus soli TaxID=2798301 RepID=A0ABS1H4B5_9BACL|nr:hypothetical protein [Viridibacillus soli]
MAYFIIGAEIAFWILIVVGLVLRYILKLKRLSIFVLAASPVIDLVLILLTVLDLKNGEIATFVHGLSAIYIGVSIAYGKQMIEWADQQFKWLVLKVDERPKKAYGKEKSKRETIGFVRHLFAYAIGSAVLWGILLFLGKDEQTISLFYVWSIWSIVVVVDGIISISYIVFPTTKK